MICDTIHAFKPPAVSALRSAVAGAGSDLQNYIFANRLAVAPAHEAEAHGNEACGCGITSMRDTCSWSKIDAKHEITSYKPT